jgi:hypothetical protein
LLGKIIKNKNISFINVELKKKQGDHDPRGHDFSEKVHIAVGRLAHHFLCQIAGSQHGTLRTWTKW